MANNRATAVVVADSISHLGIRLTTLQLRYWRPIHSELMTHRVFSRNAGSSRARPSAKIIEQVRTEPWGPIHWGKNQPGMQAREELEKDILEVAKEEWRHAARLAASQAQNLFNLGAHKQIVNRLLEPFTYIDVLVTATEFNNWDTLRDHGDADPTIQELARIMKQARDASIPDLLHDGQWHLPYITDEDWTAAERYCQIGRITRDMPSYKEKLEIVRKISVARCARVSYKAFDGTVAPIEKDLELFEQLLVAQPLHASPAEHQAMPDTMQRVEREIHLDDESGTHHAGVHEEWCYPDLHGNFNGWIQYRKMLPNEYVKG